VGRRDPRQRRDDGHAPDGRAAIEICGHQRDVEMRSETRPEQERIRVFLESDVTDEDHVSALRNVRDAERAK
jgi:hypothetical protein